MRTCMQEEELKAAMDKAVEAETRASEAEIRMKEMKVGHAKELIELARPAEGCPACPITAGPVIRLID